MVQRFKLGRPKAHRVAMLRTMVTQLLEHERIQTTLARAKQLRRLADRMITLGKRGDRNAHIQAGAVVNTQRELHKLFTTMAERYRERAGGYTRVIHTARRRHDAAKMAYIEFVDREGELRPARPPAPPLPDYNHLPASARAWLQQQRWQVLSQQQQQQQPQQQQSGS